MKRTMILVLSVILLIACQDGGCSEKDSGWSEEGRGHVMDTCLNLLKHDEPYCSCVLAGLEERLTEDEVIEMVYSPGEIDMEFFFILGEVTAECR